MHVAYNVSQTEAKKQDQRQVCGRRVSCRCFVASRLFCNNLLPEKSIDRLPFVCLEVVNCPSRWSLYLSLALCLHHLSAHSNRETGTAMHYRGCRLGWFKIIFVSICFSHSRGSYSDPLEWFAIVQIRCEIQSLPIFQPLYVFLKPHASAPSPWQTCICICTPQFLKINVFARHLLVSGTRRQGASGLGCWEGASPSSPPRRSSWRSRATRRRTPASSAGRSGHYHYHY